MTIVTSNGFKEALQALIEHHLTPESTFEDYARIAVLLHDAVDRIAIEANKLLPPEQGEAP